MTGKGAKRIAGGAERKGGQGKRSGWGNENILSKQVFFCQNTGWGAFDRRMQGFGRNSVGLLFGIHISLSLLVNFVMKKQTCNGFILLYFLFCHVFVIIKVDFYAEVIIH
jgi:hypothetical protein